MTWPFTTSLPRIAAEVRELNRLYDGPGTIALLWASGEGFWVGGWEAGPDRKQFGKEEIPGDDKPIDAFAVARRLVAAHVEYDDAQRARWKIRQVDKLGRPKRFNKNWC